MLSISCKGATKSCHANSMHDTNIVASSRNKICDLGWKKEISYDNTLLCTCKCIKKQGSDDSRRPNESCGQTCLRGKSLVPGCNTLAYRKGN